MLPILGIIAVGALIWLLTDIIFWSPGILEAMAALFGWAGLLVLAMAVIGPAFNQVPWVAPLVVAVISLLVRWFSRQWRDFVNEREDDWYREMREFRSRRER